MKGITLIMKNYRAYIKITMVHVLYLLILLVFAGGYAAFGLLDDLGKNAILLHLNNIVMGAVLTVLTLYLFRKLNKVPIKSIWGHLHLKDFYFLVVVFIVTFTLVCLFILVLSQNQNLIVSLQLDKFNEFNYCLILIWALSGWTMAALKEEVLSRGFVVFNLIHLNIGMMVFLSAMIFMSLHVPTNGGFDLYKMFSWFMGGVMYAYIYIKSGSILVATITHMIHNFLNDWILGNNIQFSIVELSQKVQPDDKLIYEVILKLVLIVLTLLFYGRNGLTTPAPNLIEVWYKKGNNNFEDKLKISQNESKYI
jgi:membrane protease YdiL (CAAX protease family)